MVTLALNVGAVPVRFSSDGSYGEMTQRDPEFGAELEGGEVAPLCGLEESDLDPELPPQIVSTGSAFAIVALKSLEPLASLKVNQQQATEWLRARGARWFYVLAPTGDAGPEWRARMQFNGGEDPATGSAAGCAISYLVRHGAVHSGTRIHLRQGVEMGRKSDLYLSAEMHSSRVSEVHVGGRTVPVAKGHIFLP
jgi:trans-2,3-dihydro-3-hydroxyanthranilate isomerase